MFYSLLMVLISSLKLKCIKRVSKNVKMPQGRACSDRACKHNKNRKRKFNSKQSFDTLCLHTRPNILLLRLNLNQGK